MFHSVELRAYAHATEDESRVEHAIRSLWPAGTVKVERLEGHHGNPLLLMACRIDRRDDIDAFWRRLKDAGAVPAILQDLDDRVDDQAILHLRVDKQSAYEGRVELARHDDVIAVRAKIIAHPAKKPAAVRIIREYLARL